MYLARPPFISLSPGSSILVGQVVLKSVRGLNCFLMSGPGGYQSWSHRESPAETLRGHIVIAADVYFHLSELIHALAS